MCPREHLSLRRLNGTSHEFTEHPSSPSGSLRMSLMSQRIDVEEFFMVGLKCRPGCP